MGVLLTLVVFAFIIARGTPASLNVQGPARLPAPTVAGGGAQTLPMKRDASGMPSPAAAAAISVERGGQAPRMLTSNVRMKGIPSPAAAATMAPATLPLRATDGMTLPRLAGERDSHAVEHHYGGSPSSATLPMRAVEQPALTPAQAAQQAESRAAAQGAIADGGYYDPQPSVPGQAM